MVRMPGYKLPLAMMGLNFKTAPIEIREHVAKSLNHQALFAKLQKQKKYQGAVLLKTCNRIELYVHHEEGVSLERVFQDFGVSKEMLYEADGQEALKHLMYVTSSLDSMVLGEPQIMGQVKQAFEEAKSEHFISPLMDRIFQKAFRVAKKVRNETQIGQHSISLSTIAVEVTREFFDVLDSKSAMIVGAGEMARLAALHFQKRGIGKLWIMNRSLDQAASLAADCDGVALPLSELNAKLEDVDILMVSTGANHHIVTSENVVPVLTKRKHRPLLCIDISVPRNIDPALHELEDVYLYGIDDLQRVVDKHIEVRQSESEEAKELIAKELEKFLHILHLPSISETIQEIHRKVRPIIDQELRRISKQLQLSEDQLPAIEKSMMHLAEKLLLNPVMYVQETEDQEDRNSRLDEVRSVFLVKEDGNS